MLLFLKTDVSYLGHVISSGGVATDPGKISAVAQWPLPNDVSELRRFLGFASYYRRFVKGFAQLAAPLHRLVAALGGSKTKRPSSQPLSEAWTSECENSFQGLKDRLVSAPVLAYADFSLPFILEVDASHSGLGAVLSQKQGGEVRPVAYASRGLRPTERNMSNYSSMKLEFLGLKWAMTEKFREYLLGQKCVVLTDNNPLSYLNTAKLGALEQCWASQIASFDYTIQYRPGRANANADALSRQFPQEDPLVTLHTLGQGTPLPTLLREAAQVDTPLQVTQSSISVLPTCSSADLVALQAADPTIGPFLRFWQGAKYPTRQERQKLPRTVLEMLRQWGRMRVEEGVLYRYISRTDGGEQVRQLVLPEALKNEVLGQLHNAHGHQGVERTTELVRPRCYWPGMLQEIKDWCQRCERCILAKAVQPKVRTSMGHLLASRPNEILAMDFTCLEPSSDGREYVLIVTDVFSKYTQAFPTRDQQASTVAGILVTGWFYRFGVPARLHSDQGRSFEGELIRQLCHLYGIQKSRTTPYHPQGNGQCERFNRTLHDLLRTLPFGQKRNWPSYLPHLMFSYNTSVHQSTGESPFLLMMGFEPNLPIDFVLGRVKEPANGSVHSWLQEHQKRLHTVYNQAKKRLQVAAECRKERHDRHGVDEGLKVGQKVYLQDRSVRGRNKIQDRWSPTLYRIVRAPEPGGSVYAVQPLQGPGQVKHVNRAHIRPVPAEPSVTIPRAEDFSARDVEEENEDADLWIWRPKPTGCPRGPVAPSPPLACPPPSPEMLRLEDSPPVELAVRRTTRSTAGRHRNIHHLPMAAGASDSRLGTS